jgi:hypothetical protein
MIKSFTPNDIQNLSMWFDGTDPLNNGIPPNNGDVLPFWRDKSKNAHVMTCQSMDTHPGIYYKAIHAEKGGVHFNKSIYSSGLTNISHDSDVFIIMRADPSSNHINLCSLYDPTLEEFSSLGKLNNKWLTDSTSVIRKASAIVQENSTQCIMLQWSVANNNYYIYRNGIRIMFSNSFTYTPGGQLNFYLGTNAPDSTNQYLGEIGEVIVYNSPLDTRSRNLVEGYLAWKWNMTLPSTHPFYGKQPLV